MIQNYTAPTNMFILVIGKIGTVKVERDNTYLEKQMICSGGRVGIQNVVPVTPYLIVSQERKRAVHLYGS